MFSDDTVILQESGTKHYLQNTSSNSNSKDINDSIFNQCNNNNSNFSNETPVQQQLKYNQNNIYPRQASGGVISTLRSNSITNSSKLSILLRNNNNSSSSNNNINVNNISQSVLNTSKIESSNHSTAHTDQLFVKFNNQQHLNKEYSYLQLRNSKKEDYFKKHQRSSSFVQGSPDFGRVQKEELIIAKPSIQQQKYEHQQASMLGNSIQEGSNLLGFEIPLSNSNGTWNKASKTQNNPQKSNVQKSSRSSSFLLNNLNHISDGENKEQKWNQQQSSFSQLSNNINQNTHNKSTFSNTSKSTIISHQNNLSLTPRAASGTSAYFQQTPNSQSGGYKINKDFARNLRSNSKNSNDDNIYEPLCRTSIQKVPLSDQKKISPKKIQKTFEDLDYNGDEKRYKFISDFEGKIEQDMKKINSFGYQLHHKNQNPSLITEETTATTASQSSKTCEKQTEEANEGQISLQDWPNSVLNDLDKQVEVFSKKWDELNQQNRQQELQLQAEKHRAAVILGGGVDQGKIRMFQGEQDEVQEEGKLTEKKKIDKELLNLTEKEKIINQNEEKNQNDSNDKNERNIANTRSKISDIMNNIKSMKLNYQARRNAEQNIEQNVENTFEELRQKISKNLEKEEFEKIQARKNESQQKQEQFFQKQEINVRERNQRKQEIEVTLFCKDKIPQQESLEEKDNNKNEEIDGFFTETREDQLQVKCLKKLMENKIVSEDIKGIIQDGNEEKNKNSSEIDQMPKCRMNTSEGIDKEILQQQDDSIKDQKNLLRNNIGEMETITEEDIKQHGDSLIGVIAFGSPMEEVQELSKEILNTSNGYELDLGKISEQDIQDQQSDTRKSQYYEEQKRLGCSGQNNDEDPNKSLQDDLTLELILKYQDKLTNATRASIRNLPLQYTKEMVNLAQCILQTVRYCSAIPHQNEDPDESFS